MTRKRTPGPAALPSLAPPTGRATLALAATILLALAFVAGILAAPAFAASGWPAGDLLRACYGGLCHQMPERSLAVAGLPHAVCARCLGLYCGGVAGLALGTALMAARRRRPRPLWLALMVLPTAVDALLPWIGIPSLPSVPRFLLALPAGMAVGVFLALGVAEIFGAPRQARIHTRAVVEEVDG